MMAKVDGNRETEAKARRPYQAPRVEFILRHGETRNNPGTGFDGNGDINNSLS